MSIGNSRSDASDAAAVPPKTAAETIEGTIGAFLPEPPAGPPVESIGRALAEARRAARFTIDEISTVTRVRVPIIQAIERDDYTRCGGDVYARGHIRTLARAVGLDPEPLVARYDDEHGGRPTPTSVGPAYGAGRIRPEPRSLNWTVAMIAAIVIVVGFVGFTLFGGGRSSGGPVTGAPAPPHPSAPPYPSAQAMYRRPAHAAAPRYASSPAPSGSPSAAVPANEVTVKLTADGGDSWVSVTNDNGDVLFEGLMHQGDSRTFADGRRIGLLVGNAGAVRLFVNGKDLGPAGSDGQILHTDFTPGDPQSDEGVGGGRE